MHCWLVLNRTEILQHQLEQYTNPDTDSDTKET